MAEKSPHRSTIIAPSITRQRYFRIKLRGQVDRGWMAAFDPQTFSSSDKVTMIEVLADQAGLRGILNHLWDLNLDIVSVAEIVCFL
jgi:hypothetical protein